MADTIATLQAQVPALQKKLQDCATALTAAQGRVDNWRNKALQCDAARAEFSVGWKKEQACSMASRGTYYTNWDIEGKKLVTATNDYTTAKNALQSLNDQIDTLNKQNQTALLSDPNFALQANAQNQANQTEQLKAAEAEKTKKTLWIVGIVTTGIAVLTGLFAMIAHFKNKAA